MPNWPDAKVTLRLDGHLVHVVYNDVLAETLPSPMPADQYTKIRGAGIAASQNPPQAPGPMSVQRKVPRDGVVMVARQRLRIGRTYTGKIRHHPRRRHPLPGHLRRRPTVHPSAHY